MFCLFQNIMKLDLFSMLPFRVAFFKLLIFIHLGSFISFHGLIAYFFFFFKLRLYFFSFRFTEKLEGGYRNLPTTPHPHTCVVSLIINMPCQRGTFVTIVITYMADHNHLEFIVYITVHSWFCTFYA